MYRSFVSPIVKILAASVPVHRCKTVLGFPVNRRRHLVAVKEQMCQQIGCNACARDYFIVDFLFFFTGWKIYNVLFSVGISYLKTLEMMFPDMAYNVPDNLRFHLFNDDSAFGQLARVTFMLYRCAHNLLVVSFSLSIGPFGFFRFILNGTVLLIFRSVLLLRFFLCSRVCAVKVISAIILAFRLRLRLDSFLAFRCAVTLFVGDIQSGVKGFIRSRQFNYLCVSILEIPG